MTAYYSEHGIDLYHADARAIPLADGSVQMCATSPPYFGLRDYRTGTWEGGNPECDHRKVRDAAAAVATSTLSGGKKTTGHLQEGYRSKCGRCGAVRIDQQIGLEETPEAYVSTLVEVFRDVRRVLKDDGVLWLNLGDSYNTDGRKGRAHMGMGKNSGYSAWFNNTSAGTKPKDLLGIPWRVAFALRTDGWYLRSAAPWVKRQCMPESVTDRPASALEYVFLLSKSDRYLYDTDAVRLPSSSPEQEEHNQRYAREYVAHTNRVARGEGIQPGNVNNVGIHARPGKGGRHRRNTDWWFESVLMDEEGLPLGFDVNPHPYPGAHFATWAPKLVRPMILAGSRPGDVVLDPFNGSGTTGQVSRELGRRYVGIDLNADYLELTKTRLRQGVLFGAPRGGPHLRPAVSETRGRR